MLQDFLMSRLVEDSTVGEKITTSAKVNQKGVYALDATEKNPLIEDTLAEQIADLSNQATGLKNTIKNIIALPNGASTGDGQIEDAKIGIEGEEYDTLGDAIREQIKTYKDVHVSNNMPTGKPKIWINTANNDDEDHDIVVPNVNDNQVNDEDTWSSKKIKEELDKLSAEIAALKELISK